MTLGDFTILAQETIGSRGGRLYNVQAGTVINAGEPVGRVLGSSVVFPCYNNAGQVGTDYIVGIATTTSNNTASAIGTVNVLPLNPQITYLATPKTAASWDTQAEYDALVGKRLTIDLTSGAYTINATDSAGNGLVVMPLDIALYPGKVAVAFRQGLSDLS